MKMKTGISIFVAAAGISFLLIQRKKRINKINFDLATNNFFSKPPKTMWQDLADNSTHHSATAFIEFFDKDSIKEAYSRYEKYLDLGLSKDDAFKCVVEDDRNI